MIYWFINPGFAKSSAEARRGRRGALLLGMPMIVLAFVLLNTAFSTQLSEKAENSDGGMDKAYEEVFFAINPADSDDVYIQWDMPKSTTTEGQYNSAYTNTNWFLGAYKCVSEYGRSGVGNLCIVLDRVVLTKDVVFVIHYFDEPNSCLYVDLLDVNGDVVLEDLYGNLITGSDMNMVLSLDMPLVSFPNAGVIQLRCGAGEATALTSGEQSRTSEDEVPALSGAEVYESRIYIEGDKSRLIAAQEFYASESEHNKGANDSGAVSGIYPVAAQTAVSRDNLKEEDQFNPAQDTQRNTAINSISKAGIIFVDHITGDDQFSGRLPVICGQDGPKRTIRNGIATAGAGNNMLVIKSGAYNEDLDIKGRDVQVIVSGDVRL